MTGHVHLSMSQAERIVNLLQKGKAKLSTSNSVAEVMWEPGVVDLVDVIKAGYRLLFRA
ncbi:hypothetical protein Fuma_04170 [Fuerstiella marisgermanici]|uniref:Uncharacterized protein n=1 Tax=Fuerstiella marisgermanici TaxID=1891926 RepID=A0A1P8WKG3_9PLAN|nr:hypothetical protein Fuma_04170 [Fuerstiella marisgermanici]